MFWQRMVLGEIECAKIVISKCRAQPWTLVASIIGLATTTARVVSTTVVRATCEISEAHFNLHTAHRRFGIAACFLVPPTSLPTAVYLQGTSGHWAP